MVFNHFVIKIWRGRPISRNDEELIVNRAMNMRNNGGKNLLPEYEPLIS